MLDAFYQAARQQLGTLTEEQFNNCTHNGWQCVSHKLAAPGRRDAFVGNGLIGIRVPIEGQPSVYPAFAEVKMAPGGTQMYGMWDSEFMMPVFNFMGLELRHGRSIFRRDSGAILNYSQILDWRTGSVTTECDWVHWGGSVHIQTRIYMARHLKHLGCVELTITPDGTRPYTVIDRVDGSFMPLKGEMEYQLQRPSDGIKTVFGYFGARRRMLAASTAVLLDGEYAAGDVVTQPGGYSRQINMRFEGGRSYKFVKFGALFSDLQSSDPINAAATLVGGAAADPEQVWQDHVAEWAKLWEHDIEIDHPGAQMLARNALYQLYSNLSENLQVSPGPTGLTGNAWGGHIFYDADTWTFPPMAVMNPELARCYVDYRFNTLPGARRNAAAHRMKGAEIAWESAEFGDETIPSLPYATQRHINSDVALAQWQYYLVTGDKDFLRDQAMEVLAANADFWVSRANWNAAEDRYEIHNVCCPDEYALIKNNNAMTNYSAKASIGLAIKASRILDRPIDPDWQKVADKLWIPFDEVHNCIKEHDTFDGGCVKQADATLVIYPWEMPLSEEVKRNTVDYYRQFLESQKIMMSSAIDGVIACELNDPETGWQMLLDLLQHIRGDFLLASESAFNETMSLLTGLGGMLQLFIMGFGGVRIHDDELQYINHLPAAIKSMKLKKINYNGQCFDLCYQDGKVTRTDH